MYIWKNGKLFLKSAAYGDSTRVSSLCVLSFLFQQPQCSRLELIATCNQWVYLKGSCWEAGHRWEDRSQSKGSDPTRHLLTETERKAAWWISAPITFTLSLASSSLEVKSFEPVMQQLWQPELPPRMWLSLTFIGFGQIVLLTVSWPTIVSLYRESYYSLEAAHFLAWHTTHNNDMTGIK